MEEAKKAKDEGKEPPMIEEIKEEVKEKPKVEVKPVVEKKVKE